MYSIFTESQSLQDTNTHGMKAFRGIRQAGQNTGQNWSQLNAHTIPKLYKLGPKMKEELIHKKYRKLVDMEESPDFEEDTFEEPTAKPLYKKKS